MTIREYLEQLGATQGEMAAKVVGRMERAMMVDADLSQFKADTVLSVLDKATRELETAKSKSDGVMFRVEALTKQLNSAASWAQANLDDLKKQTAGLKDAKIEDRDTKDAAMAYAFTLRATKEIFGEENMTENVMVAAINAGSYMAWRSIMGPKGDEGPKSGQVSNAGVRKRLY